jgi:hypothetical protein
MKAPLEAAVAIAFFGIAGSILAESTHTITIDGNFSDWASIPSHYDPVGGPGVLAFWSTCKTAGEAGEKPAGFKYQGTRTLLLSIIH